MDTVKGDPIASRPDHYQVKNRLVRARFDALEKEFAAGLPAVLEEAVEAKNAGDRAVAHILDEFTENCFNRVLIALEELAEELD